MAKTTYGTLDIASSSSILEDEPKTAVPLLYNRDDNGGEEQPQQQQQFSPNNTFRSMRDELKINNPKMSPRVRRRRSSSVRAGPVLTAILDKKESYRHRKVRASESQAIPETCDNGSTRQQEPPPRPNKSFVYTMLNPRSNAWQAVTFKWFITAVILLDLVMFVISTEPNLSQEQCQFFHFWEGVTSTIFLLEYLARLIVVTESKKYGALGPVWGRLKYMTTTPALIDLVATLPFFLELVTGWDIPTLTYIRSFRLLRILKTSGFMEATNAVYRVIYYNRQILYVALIICIGLVLLTAVLMYYLRPQDPDQQQDFQSLGATMYLSTLMLTGQGGPDGELPWYTKGVVLLTGVFSIGMFAIPASMLTWGFEAEAERCARLAYLKQRQEEKQEQNEGHTTTTEEENDNWSYSSEDYSTDEEYQRIITGADDNDDDDDDEVNDRDKYARRQFVLGDVDGSGSMSLAEFLALSRQQAEFAAAKKEVSSENIDDLLTRITKLERCVQDNSHKLDKIFRILEEVDDKK